MQKGKQKREELRSLLGKRQRTAHIIKRTTSMTKMTFDDVSKNSEDGGEGAAPAKALDPKNTFKRLEQPFTASATAAVRPRIQRRHSAAAEAEIADFLRACWLCRRRLIPDRDIYMYRGDEAFCSLECRQQQMNQDERKRGALTSNEEAAVTIETSSEVSANGETAAAV